MKTQFRFVLLAAAAALAPTLALAHPGDHEHMDLGLIAHHIITSPDHFLELIMLGLMIAGALWRVHRRRTQR